jgi:hypothetical protein
MSVLEVALDPATVIVAVDPGKAFNRVWITNGSGMLADPMSLSVSRDGIVELELALTGRCINLRVVPPETDGASASKAMTAATHHSVQPHPGDAATAVDAAETRSLHELSLLTYRLPVGLRNRPRSCATTGSRGFHRPAPESVARAAWPETPAIRR